MSWRSRRCRNRRVTCRPPSCGACRRTMVATDVPGCGEVAIPNETGLLVPPDDADALAAAIEQLARSPDLRARFGRAARRLAEERFAADAIGRAVLELYLRLVA